MAKKKLLEPLKVKKLGQPYKPDKEKKDPNTGLTGEMMAWRKKEALGRGVPETDIMREAFAMYMASVESQREELPVIVEDLKTK